MSGATTATSPASGINNVGTYTFNAGVTTVTYTVKDNSNNTAVCSFTVTINDNIIPTITCPGDISTAKISDDGTGDCLTTVTLGTPITADNCSVLSVVPRVGGVVINPLIYKFPIGTTTVQWTVTDNNSNSATCDQSVTVADDESPIASCKDITIYLDALGTATISPDDIDDGSYDQCTVIFSKTVSMNTFNSSNIGPNNVTLTVYDDDGNFSSCTAVVTVMGSLPPTAYYSYQTGFWDVASTWTTDPGGTTGPGSTVPGPNDKVVILTGRTVYLQSDVTSTNLDITINAGGILDQTSFQFTQPLTALKGGGIHKLASSNYPTATTNTFVTTDGGTTEYNHSGDMSSAQSTYYNLIIRSAGTVTQVNNLTINGNVDVKAGKFQVNDATNTRRILVINGDVTVDAGASIGVGTGVTNTVTDPTTAPAGEAGGFVNYYETQSHRIQIFGNFTNNGIVKFTNLDYPVYNAFPSTTPGTTTGFATVYFSGATDKTVNLNGPTTFYNMVVQKGADQTFKLTLYSAAYNYFRLFGANTSRAETPGANPLVKKALWIRSGTLILQGLSGIPSLSEGNLPAVAGYTTSDYFIPQNGAMILDGGGVIVLSTADDYTEVNVLYSLTSGNNGLCGITTGGYSGLSLLGKLQVNDGYLSTRESSGLLYWSYASGQFILNGGKVDLKQLHNPQGTNVGLISYVQSAGSMILRGRFINTVSYASAANIMNPVISAIRTTNGIDATAGIGTFSISSNTNNAFGMSGGTITVHDVCNDVGTPLAFLVNCPVSNINVSGGTVEFKPKTQTIAENHYVNSLASFYNFIVNRESGNASVYLLTNPLVVSNDLSLTSGILNSNNLDVTVGRNFTISNSTTYTTGSNTTIFNGTGAQSLTMNLGGALSVNKLTIGKPAGTVLTLAGSQGVINVGSDFMLDEGTLNDGGKTINIAGILFNSGIHTGTDPGKIVLNGTAVQSIGGNGVFRNIDLNNTNAASAPVSLAANMTVTGALNLANDKLFNIGMHNLKLESTASVLNYSTSRYLLGSGNSGDAGVTRVYTSSAPFLFPVGAPTITPSHPNKYTPATIGFSSDPTTFGSITVTPVGYEYPVTTVNNVSLTYYWKIRSTGFTGYAAKVTHQFKYDDLDIAGTEANYVPALFNISTSSWNYGLTADVADGGNQINDWTSPGNSSNFIDADYTAGDPTAFGTPQTYYSRQSGLWSNTNTWSLTGHTDGPAGSVPGANDIVIIGNGHTVNLYNDLAYSLNTATVSCASLQIATGSTLDIGNNPGSVFSMVKNHPSGNGTFRITASQAVDTPLGRVSLFSFPQNSDFSDFNVNLGTTEFYTTTNIGNSLYILPPISYVGNMLLSPLGDAGSGDNMTLQNVSSLTIYGDLTTQGTTAYSAIGLSWNTNNAFYGNQVTYTTIEKTVTIKGDLNINGGSFTYYDDIAAQHLIVEGDVNIAATNGSCIIVWDSDYGYTPYQNGPALANT
ncbi:MAG: HYR domain-containing protein [Bacteroidetes bacterium]|nr:HYR domain-containing protein [Bacteroidota bacterium]